MNKINYILIIITFYCLIVNNTIFINSQDYNLLPEEKETAQIIADLVALDKGLNPCFTLLCEPFDSDYYYVEKIDLSFVLDTSVSLEGINITVFQHLKSLVMNEFIYPQSNILSQLVNLNSLELLSINNLVEGVDVELPKSLASISFYNFKGTFYSKWVNNNLLALTIANSIDFEISGGFNKNEIITTLSIPVPSTSGLPKLDTVFPNLKYLTIYMKNVSSSDSIIPSSYLGSFSFSSLESLSFLLDQNSTTNNIFSKLFYLPDFSKLSSLSSLIIESDAFTLKSNQVFDLSNINNNHSLDVEINNNNNLFKDCNNCLKLRQDTRFSMDNVQVMIDSIDLSTCSKISLGYIGPKQNITFKTFNFNQTKSLSISNSLVQGDLPEDLCKISFENVDINNNLFSTKVPSCYLCTSNTEIRDSILPNQFSLNFTTYTPVSCPNFKIDNIKEYYLIDTIGESIYISGYDLGFLVSFNGDYYSSKFEVVNQLLRIDINSGIGSKNRTVNATLLDDEIITFNYSYIKPTITSYYINLNDNSLNLVGSGFDYNGDNNLVSISVAGASQTYNVTGSVDYAPHISIPLDELKEGQSFNVKVLVEDQESALVSFDNYNTESISITDEYITLNSTGSTVTVSGVFLTSDISKVNLVIGGITCTVSKVSATSLTFTYPKSTKNVGTTPLFLIIDGKFFKTNVNVNLIQDNSSTSNDNSESSDYVSSSFKIKISTFIILINLIIVIII